MAEAMNLPLAFKALGDTTRLKILELLRSRGMSCCDLISRKEPGLCACDIERAVGLSQAAVSHHIGLLRRAGLVCAEKRGAGRDCCGTRPSTRLRAGAAARAAVKPF